MLDGVNMATNRGSSTIVAVTIDKNENKIYGAYLGDSNYMVFRFDSNGNVRLVFESPI